MTDINKMVIQFALKEIVFVGDVISDTNGGFHIITNFDNKFSGVSNGGIMAVAGNQTRVSSAATALGNQSAPE